MRRVSGNKEISEAGGGVGTRARARGVVAIGPRREGSMSNGLGCETREARETRETGERGVRGIRKAGAAGSVRADLHPSQKSGYLVMLLSSLAATMCSEALCGTVCRQPRYRVCYWPPAQTRQIAARQRE